MLSLFFDVAGYRIRREYDFAQSTFEVLSKFGKEFFRLRGTLYCVALCLTAASLMYYRTKPLPFFVCFLVVNIGA